jgi:ankyrin repeat protein
MAAYATNTDKYPTNHALYLSYFKVILNIPKPEQLIIINGIKKTYDLTHLFLVTIKNLTENDAENIGLTILKTLEGRISSPSFSAEDLGLIWELFITALEVNIPEHQTKLIDNLTGSDILISRLGRHAESLMHQAVHHENIEVIKRFLKHNVNVNAKNINGDYYEDTPLHIATRKGNKEIVELLIAHGADINMPNYDDNTPLHIATMGGNIEIVELLIARGADINLPNYDEDTPLHIATRKGNKEIVELLIAHHANIDQPNDWNEDTPLHIATRKGNKEIVELLINGGANTNIQNKYESTPLHIATKKNYKEIVKLLLQKEPSLHCANKHGSIPLHIAAENQDGDLLELLLSADCIQL